MQRLNDRWLTLIGIPLFAVIASLVFYTDEWMIHGFSYKYCLLVSFFVITIHWFANRSLLILMRTWYPTVKQTTRRVLFQFLFTTILCSGISFLISFYYDKTRFWGVELSRNDYIFNAIVNLFFTYTAVVIYETTFFFSKWKQSVRETEELKKSNLQSQLDSLKNQVSPHFLFNSLNTLSSLIEEDQTQAVQFVNELSRVYRYLLQSNDKELTTLRDEISFLNAYFFLLKTRFGEAIQMEIAIDDEYMSYLIPPLTLQILVENAVKHNIVSLSRPLLIEIKYDGYDQLSVLNNIQKKTVHVASNGMGLSNISAKFKLLNQPDIIINTDDNKFRITLPLLKN
jgi:sensor histidine kinase YesM